MASRIMKRWEQRAKEAEERILQRKEVEAEIQPVAEDDAPKSNLKKGMTSDELANLASRQIYKNEQLGLFDAIALSERDVIPTLLTRIPIFMPVSKTRQKKLLDEDNALVFETRFGSGKRYGANLTTFDEDVMYALARLAKKKLIGPREAMPIKVPKIYKSEAGRVDVDTVVCTVTDILNVLELSKGGKMRRKIVDSLERLASTTLVLKLNREDRYLGKCEIGKPIKLVDIEWGLYSSDGIVYAQFSPVVTYWLEHEHTYFNWETRKKLNSRLAKALHRYISSQTSPKNKSFFRFNEIEEIAASIGCAIRKRDLKHKFSLALDELVKAGFLLEYEFEGTGRGTPIRLYAELR